MAGPLTDDHASCDSAAVDRGLFFLEATPHHLRGPCVPAIKALGLAAKEACAAARLHHLKQAAEVLVGPPGTERKKPAGYEPAGPIESHYRPDLDSTSRNRRKGGVGCRHQAAADRQRHGGKRRAQPRPARHFHAAGSRQFHNRKTALEPSGGSHGKGPETRHEITGQRHRFFRSRKSLKSKGN